MLDGQLDVPSPIGVTRTAFEAYEHSAWTAGPVIVDTSPPSVAHALYLWNLRATAIPSAATAWTRLVWLPPEALDDPAVRGRLREASLASETDPDLVLNGADADYLRSTPLRMGFIESPGTSTRSRIEFPGNLETSPSDPFASGSMRTRPCGCTATGGTGRSSRRLSR